MESSLVIRPVRQEDAQELSRLLNEIIARGGTTALEDPIEPSSLAAAFLTGPDVICCFVACEHSTGRLIGFQTLMKSSSLPNDVVDIGTFARVGLARKGIGTALFGATRTEARHKGMVGINATIRADNSGGLAFYHRLGFMDHGISPAVPLKDGTLVDRVSKRYSLGSNFD